jgi:hypothetical protein
VSTAKIRPTSSMKGDRSAGTGETKAKFTVYNIKVSVITVGILHG